MRARIVNFVKWILLIWGGFSLGVLVVAGVLFGCQLNTPSADQMDSASPNDVRFVLNWCRLGDNRMESVIHSYVSARDLTGDHLDAYAIKISHIDVAELVSNTTELTGRWYRGGDQLPQILDEAVKFVGGCSRGISWFPSEAELRRSDIYIYPWSIYCEGITPSGAKLVFVRPSDKMVFYFGCRM
jgi:hypothetical protein